MLLPAEASHRVLVARQSGSSGSGNITTVTAVRDDPLNVFIKFMADLAKGRCVHSNSYLRHIPILPSAQIDPRTTRQPEVHSHAILEEEVDELAPYWSHWKQGQLLFATARRY